MRTECGRKEIGRRARVNGYLCDVLIGEYKIKRLMGIVQLEPVLTPSEQKGAGGSALL